MPAWQVPLQQALHWLGPIVAVRIIFLQFARGQMAADSVALMILLVLAVTSLSGGNSFRSQLRLGEHQFSPWPRWSGPRSKPTCG